jgi:hypothetical protein
VWFLIEPLPNAPNLGGPKVRRWMFLARAIPEVVPDVTYHESYLGMALDELSHLEYLPQRLPILLAAGFIGAAAISVGSLVLRGLGLSRSLTTLERLAVSYGLGASLLGVAILILGRFGFLAPWPIRIGLGLLTLAEVVCMFRDRWSQPGDLKSSKSQSVPSIWMSFGFAAVVGPFLVLMILGAMLPTIDFDAIEYHLQGPKEYFQTGRITFLTHNVYTSMPFNVEMLHLLSMVVLGDWWSGALAGQVLISFHAIAGTLLVGLTASRWGSPLAGWFAAVVYATTPWIYRLGVLPYVEGPLCDYHAALLWAGALGWTERETRSSARFWALAGLLAGGAMGCKYTALISAVIPFGLAALLDSIRRRSPKLVLVFALGWAALMTPWLAKNVIDTRNPVYPLGYNVFRGRHWDAAMDRKWANAHGPRPISAGLFWQSMVDVAGRSDWQSPLYLALGGWAFLRRGSWRFALVLAAYIAYLFSTWWLFTHRLDRFWLPLLPAAAVLAGLGADWTRRLTWRILIVPLFLIAILTNLSYSSTALTALNEWTADLRELRSSVPERLNPALAGIDAWLPPDAKILLVGQAAVFHVEHPVVYNTVFDDETFETIAKGHTASEVREGFKRLGITHVFVDWFEIDRYRSPANYGFTPFVTHEEFDRLVKAGVLGPPREIGDKRVLYEVISSPA